MCGIMFVLIMAILLPVVLVVWAVSIPILIFIYKAWRNQA